MKQNKNTDKKKDINNQEEDQNTTSVNNDNGKSNESVETRSSSCIR